jgi:hypothetical protein
MSRDAHLRLDGWTNPIERFRHWHVDGACWRVLERAAGGAGAGVGGEAFGDDTFVDIRQQAALT